MMTCRDLGIGSILNCLPLVLLTNASALSSSSSPSAASMSGQTIMRRPRLMPFWRKMRAKSRATMISSGPLRHDTACSREEPQPKFFPPNRMLPGGICFALSFALKAASSAKANWGVSVGRTVAM